MREPAAVPAAGPRSIFPEETFLRDLLRLGDVRDGGTVPDAPPSAAAPAVRAGAAPGAGQPLVAPPDCDWDRFVSLVRRHGVLHAARSALSGAVGVPARVPSALDRFLLEVRSVNILLLDRLRRVAGILEEARVPFLVLKGPALQAMLYSDLAERPMSDLDLLTHRGDLPRTLAALADAGLAVPRGGERRFWETSYHHITVAMGRDLPVQVEVHWDLELRERYPVPLEDLWERRSSFSSGERVLPTLSREDHYLFGCIHLARHFHAPRLVWLLDQRRMARAWGLDWAAIRDRAVTWRARTALGFVAEYEERVFGDSAQPAPIRPRLQPLQRRLLGRLAGDRPLEPLRDVARESRRIFATLLFFDRPADVVRFLWVHWHRKALKWTGIERLLRARH